MTSEQRQLAKMIIDAGPGGTVALTGAGISTPSGIPDFRGKGGLWEQYDPMEVAHIDVFRHDPERFWRFYRQRLDITEGIDPNRAHQVLVELEQQGYLAGIITQNIDGLHTRAGSQVVHEVHGSVRTLSCPGPRCRKTFSREQVQSLFASDDGVPYCPSCLYDFDLRQPLKPDVVLFGELLPVDTMDSAYALSQEARLMLCVGSSLVVQPVGSLPELVLQHHGTLAVINSGETPYDQQATIKLSSDVADELDGVAEALKALQS